MVKASTWFTLFITALATLAATASCGSDEGTGGGTAGGGILTGNAGNAGISSSAGNAGRGGSVGRAGSGSGGGTTNPSGSTLGAKCSSDANCGTGMVCLTPSSTALNGGGPANGMCTLACAATTDCSALESGADCFNFGTMAAPQLYCLGACTQGGTDATTAATKCQGRGDFSCVDLSAAGATVPEPFCIPLCRSDLECGTGLFCNKGTGLCSKTKVKGDPVGTACTPGTMDACEGFCIRTTADGVTPVKGVCAEFCAGFLDCQYTGDKPGGLCAGPLSDTFGILDLGYCLPSCNCTGECPFPGDLCRAWTADESTFSADLGAPGLCYPNATGTVELSCGEGGAGGAPSVDPGAAGAAGSAN